MGQTNNLEIGKNLVYLTVADFAKLACGFAVRQGGVYAQLGQGAPLEAFKAALLEAEKFLGEKRASVRFDTFVCWKCSERFATVTVTNRGCRMPRKFCDECAPTKRQSRKG